MKSGLLHSKFGELDRLPEPYSRMEPRTIQKECLSVYNEGQRFAQLNGIVIRAALEYFGGNRARAALVKVRDDSYAAEAEIAEGTLVVNVHANGRVRAAIRKEDGNYVAVPPFDGEHAVDPMAVILCFLPVLRDGFEEVDQTLSSMESDSQNLRPFREEDLYRLSDAVTRIITEKRLETDIRENNIAILDAQTICNGGLRFHRVICGSPVVLAEETETSGQSSTLTVAQARKEFAAFISENEWTEEETAFIPEFEDDFQVPEETLKMARRYLNSRNERRPMVNFMWRGITAYGKSTGVEIMACILHMPLDFAVCQIWIGFYSG